MMVRDSEEIVRLGGQDDLPLLTVMVRDGEEIVRLGEQDDLPLCQ